MAVVWPVKEGMPPGMPFDHEGAEEPEELPLEPRAAAVSELPGDQAEHGPAACAVPAEPTITEKEDVARAATSNAVLVPRRAKGEGLRCPERTVMVLIQSQRGSSSDVALGA